MNPIMEEDQDREQNKKKNKQHVCKFCSKRFPCGRSLGGHMRSHVINASSSAETDQHEKLRLAASADSEAGYGLRENPKKTWRLNSSEEEDTLFLNKFCRECGKGFPSSKSLFGHMKCHSEKERSVSNNNNNNTANSFFDDQVQDSSWNTNTNDDDDSCLKLVFDSQSDNEATNTAPNRRKRSKRVRTRYMVAPPPPPPPSTNSSNVSEIEQDEVVAMSLILLSRDVGNWGGINSVPDNNNNSNLLNFDAPSSAIEGKRKKNKVLVTNGSDYAAKLTKPKGEKSSEILSASTNHNKYTSIKAKFLDSEAEFSKICHQNKRGMFECTTCNKIFHSYQALGGHRASHKKIKGCFASRNYEGSENSIEFEEPDPSSIITDPTTTAAETSNNKKKNSDINNKNELYHLEQHHEEEEVVVETESKNKGKGFHECPICLRVFTSGQALGGHKRSHMSNNGGSIEAGKKCQNQRVVLHESVQEIRDFLDLNLPADDAAAAEEEISNNSSHVDVNYRPWWVVGGGNHKQEALLGLISN